MDKGSKWLARRRRDEDSEENKSSINHDGLGDPYPSNGLWRHDQLWSIERLGLIVLPCFLFPVVCESLLESIMKFGGFFYHDAEVSDILFD